ncbi:MAG: hypothetical protein AAF652_20350 [Cyanobacteria bacterium P01_C01_bin.72]
MTTEYYVRPNMVLHREIVQRVKGKEVKGTKLYQGGETLEKLSIAEVKKYQHLIETEEQLQSRQAKTTAKAKAEK